VHAEPSFFSPSSRTLPGALSFLVVILIPQCRAYASQPQPCRALRACLFICEQLQRYFCFAQNQAAKPRLFESMLLIMADPESVSIMSGTRRPCAQMIRPALEGDQLHASLNGNHLQRHMKLQYEFVPRQACA
jgi:hypothetical protein